MLIPNGIFRRHIEYRNPVEQMFSPIDIMSNPILVRYLLLVPTYWPSKIVSISSSTYRYRIELDSRPISNTITDASTIEIVSTWCFAKRYRIEPDYRSISITNTDVSTIEIVSIWAFAYRYPIELDYRSISITITIEIASNPILVWYPSPCLLYTSPSPRD